MDFSLLASRVGKFASDNAPSILTGFAAAGVVTTAYLTGRASFKAADILRDERKFAHPEELTPREIVHSTWRLYIPPVGTGALTIFCVIAANRIGMNRAAALAAAYSIMEKAHSDYRAKVVEKIGERKERSYRDEMAQERVNKNPPDTTLVVDESSVLCLEGFTGRYFIGDMETIRRAVNDVNHMLMQCSYASLSEFYDRVGLPRTSVSDEVGWNSDRLLEMSYSTTLSPSAKPCIVLEYNVEPVRRYYRLQ